MKTLFISSPCVWCILFAFIALAQSGSAEPQRALPLQATPFYTEPAVAMFPAGYVGKRDTCLVDTTLIDTAGGAWFGIVRESGRVWLQARHLRFAVTGPADSLREETVVDTDAKKRAAIVHNHPEWPIRIKMAVRKGQICLDMTEEQLVAAWGEPAQKTTVFMVGAGEFYCWIYLSADKKKLLVMLRDKKVAGWSK